MPPFASVMNQEVTTLGGRSRSLIKTDVVVVVVCKYVFSRVESQCRRRVKYELKARAGESEYGIN